MDGNQPFHPPIQGRYLFYMGVTLGSLLVMAGLLIYFFHRLEDEQQQVRRTNEILKQVEIVSGQLREAELRVHAALLLDVPLTSPTLATALAKVPREFENITRLVLDPDARSQLEGLIQVALQKRQVLLSLGAALEQGQVADAQELLRAPASQAIFDEFKQQFQKFEDFERVLLSQRVGAAYSRTGLIWWLVHGSLLLTLLMVMFAYYQLGRELRQRSRIDQALRASEERFRAMSENAPLGIFTSSATGTVEYVNPAWTQMAGIPAEQALGDRWAAAIHPEDRESTRQRWLEACREGRNYHGEFRFLKPDGEIVWIASHAAPMRNRGVVTGFVGISENVTERRLAQDAINFALHEKTVLLKEIHHRVKNNLQVITSLLQLQIGATQDEAVRELLRDSRNRILSMALIHEALYQSPNLARVNIRVYLQKLMHQLLHAQGTQGIEFTLEAEDLLMSPDHAITCGLIVNELVSNALKYARDPDGALRIEIVLVRHDGMLDLRIADNGPGLPEGLDVNQTSTLGLKLVNALTRQIDGSLSYASEGGACYTLSFTEEPVLAEATP